VYHFVRFQDSLVISQVAERLDHSLNAKGEPAPFSLIPLLAFFHFPERRW
jgi:hypothetical protein